MYQLVLSQRKADKKVGCHQLLRDQLYRGSSYRYIGLLGTSQYSSQACGLFEVQTKLGIHRRSCFKRCVPWSKVTILGMVIPPLIGNPYNGYINPYYWVDDHPLLYGNNGSLDPGTCNDFFILLPFTYHHNQWMTPRDAKQNTQKRARISLWTTHAFSDVAVVPFP